MDRFASNTLRTLGIVAISIFVIIGSLLLLLLALCFGMLGGVGSPGHHDPQAVNLFYGSILAVIVLVTVGVLSIAKLAKGIVRDSANSQLPALQTESKSLSPAPPVGLPPHLPDALPSAIQPTIVQPSIPRPPVTRDIVTHLSPSSRAAIHNLVLAIAAQIAAQVAIGVLGWQWALRSSFAVFRPSLPIVFVCTFASNLPYLVLLVSLLLKPGRRAFAYSLAIPSFLILFGTLGNSATIFYFLRFTHSAASFLLLIPWALHIFVFYLAWKAIRLTGILPNPARLIVAAVVVFLYYSLLPVVVLVLNYFHR
jgi:hypothetical protein